uniref:G-protein coupled receptors family 1 profile domain-containing protein n=1 Tax=Ditylenchus dipsaci TaxID=166011 RepID=A0A915DL62_9BILA
MMLLQVFQLVITFAQFCWFHIHGFPPVIYLVFNPTIRKDAKKMFKGPIKKFKPHKVHASSKTASSAGGRTSNSVL